jgi:leucyl-tRNA synthetase
MGINFKKIEKKWQKKWESDKTFQVTENSKKPKYYCLEMFPYPSGSGLHMGHAWNYSIGDILARFKIMQGFNVLHPMGYDALGLPAENAAIKDGTPPEDYTKKAIQNYIKQQKELGLSYDWSRLLSTADPSFYKWDQWIFLELFKKNLAYQKKSAVNWCPECDTVLANEQVHEGKCWRHEDTEVETKNLLQWFFKTTAYANELYDNIDSLDWPERTKIMQKNWIGKSEGVEIKGKIKGTNIEFIAFDSIPQTYVAQTFAVIAPDHPKLSKILEGVKNKGEILKVAKNIIKKRSQTGYGSNKEIEGIFTGKYIEDLYGTGDLPLWISSFAIADYGSGMVVCSAHDQRDFDFAKKYDIPLRPVMFPQNKAEKRKIENLEYCYTKDPEGILELPEKFKGRRWNEAREDIINYMEKKKFAKKSTNFKLRDWGISRQRYWGTPIPIIHCKDCGAVPVPEKDLPVVLPKNVKFGKGNPLETAKDWIKVKCPKCKKPAKRETDTMDTFVNSSWYFLRYCDPHNDKKIFDKKKASYWTPVDTYIGGAEHACMHLIYFRFYTKFLRDLGLIKFSEPVKKLFHQGMLKAEGGEKMSKSKGNIILPETVSDKYGIDTARFFMSNLASPDKDIDWDEHGITGSLKFIQKIFRYFENKKEGKTPQEIETKLNKTINDITIYYDSFEYRKATIALRELFDKIESQPTSKETKERFLQLLNPICPHITEELWKNLGNKNLISTSQWPKSKKIRAKKSSENLTKKVIENLKILLKKNNAKKAIIYVMPFELSKVDQQEIKKEIKISVEIFAVNDPKKYDPQKKASKAKPGKPSVYLE